MPAFGTYTKFQPHPNAFEALCEAFTWAMQMVYNEWQQCPLLRSTDFESFIEEWRTTCTGSALPFVRPSFRQDKPLAWGNHWCM